MDYLKWLGATVIGTITALWVSLPTAVWYLLLFMALDYLTGIIAGYKKKNLSSDVGLEGLKKKALVLILVGTAHGVSHAAELGYDLGAGVALAYTVNEVISIVENCARADVWVPPVLLDALAKMKRTIGGKREGPERRGSNERRRQRTGSGS